MAAAQNDGDSAQRHLVFVYGTLKTGQPNHHVMNDAKNGAATFVGKARTEKKWPLVISSKYNIPFLLPHEGRGNNIIGEVYSVDDKMLKFLDDFEGYPTYYGRIDQPLIRIADDGSDLETRLTATTYFLEDFRPYLLELPYISDYHSYGSHGLPYTDRLWRTAHVEAADVFGEVKLTEFSVN